MLQKEKKIKKTALIGAGAVGAYVISGLYDVPEIDFTLIAGGERKERLLREGLWINGRQYFPRVQTAQEAGGQDLILIATKYQGLAEAIAMLPDLMGDHTLVMSLLNGVDSEEQIASAIGEAHVVPALIRISSERKGREITFRLVPEMGIFYGIPADRTDDLSKEALPLLQEFFAKTGLYTHVSVDILTDIWKKYAGNVSNNLVQAVLRLPAAFYYQGEHGLFLAGKLWAEVGLVAKSKGIEIGDGPVVFVGGDYRKARWSTLQDLDAGRHTEVDMFAGVLMNMAAEAGIEVPYATFCYHAIHILEEENDGLFRTGSEA